MSEDQVVRELWRADNETEVAFLERLLRLLTIERHHVSRLHVLHLDIELPDDLRHRR